MIDYVNSDYAIYAEASDTPVALSDDNNLSLYSYFMYYPSSVSTNDIYTTASGGTDTGGKQFRTYPFSLSTVTVQDSYWREKIYPLLPEDFKNQVPATTTYHLLYSAQLINEYSDNLIYGCVYIQYVGTGDYIRLDNYLGLDIAPETPNYNDDIFFLYDLGQKILSNNLIEQLLNFDINGSTFFDLLFGGGFIVFVGWCIIKWVIPL